MSDSAANIATDLEKRLRDEVRVLGQFLGEVLSLRGEPGLFELVERIRLLAKKTRRGGGSQAELRELLGSMETRHMRPLARAFSQFLALANVAELGHRARVERRTVAASVEHVFSEKAAKHGPDALYEAVASMRVELVFTAHPTQIVRRTILEKHRRIAGALRVLHRDESKAHALTVLRREIMSIWHTDELRRAKPTPVDEAMAGFVLVEQSLWDALPAALRSLDDALEAATGRRLPRDATPLRLGSWMGGDRDGNPNVTAHVTEEVCALARNRARDLYRRELAALHGELSAAPCNAALRERVGDAREPYRAWLLEIDRRLAATDGTGYENARALHQDLDLCYASLAEVGLEILATGRLLDLLRRVSAFGTSLLQLDVREEASRHTAALDAVTRALDIGSYTEWTEDAREAFLIRELESRRPLVPRDRPDDAALSDVLGTLEVCARQPDDALGAYVISMADSASDVLAVHLLQREAGVRKPLRVVPLFETLDALDRAPGVIRRLLDLGWFRERIAGKLEIMVGYSDSGKDIGRFGAAWALYRAQEELSALCNERGVELTFFHGRGGTIARGGGPIALAIFSQPPGSVGGRLRLTIQGETIDSTFGVTELAIQSLSRYALATLEATIDPPAAPKPEWRKTMDRLADVGGASYRKVVRETPGFVDFFRAATPAEELGRLNVGSRPARRRKGGGIESLRAIPWIFAWTQTRLHLPTWLGVGEALRQVSEEGDDAELREMARDWPFFRSTLDLVEMVLAKVDLSVARTYEETLVPEALRPIGEELRQRCEETTRRLLAVKGEDTLLARDEFLRQSIALRNPYVDPLNLLQAELLRRARASEDPEVIDALLVTVNGIAAGMRNTG